jgi:hypothetical protein
MLLTTGDKVFIAYRRLFEKDESRFFVGCVDGFVDGIAKVTGHSFVRDAMAGTVVEKTELRTKIFAIASGTLIVYVLPETVDIDSLTFLDREGALAMTDGQSFAMNLTEHPHRGEL